MRKNPLRSVNSRETPVTWLTCYDYSLARVLNATDLDMILVGDSGGMVSLGYPDTNPVSMAEMLTFCRAVRRGAPSKFLIGDMPKGSYEASDRDAVNNAMKFIKSGGADAVKLEGGQDMASRAAAIAIAGIDVIGHIGLTPQSSGRFGGYRVVGRSDEEKESLVKDSEMLRDAGVCGILLEATPPLASQAVRNSVDVPILGIGAGPELDGQLMILHDLLGLYPDFRPKFAKCYVPDVMEEFVSSKPGDTTEEFRNDDGLARIARLAVDRFIADVQDGSFPGPSHAYRD